jgi:hypothetical protein
MVVTRSSNSGMDELHSQLTKVQAGLDKVNVELSTIHTRIDDRVALLVGE